ncbi:hypothetical protein P7I17_gp49 [Escherichia phage Halfdan]|uniref:Uncharacterized protein n=1 Tax=Escherichia phage Halfdan TaxID=2234092 RepID=A0A2Z5H4A3_9CAUD|nr:hypothetical protein P7I17_gp49 [Escherichia phage Halfdan]AXC34303.1 hypothetical protein [Escherichia phage Halfdan]
MAQLMQAFDARNVDPTQGVGGLPIGKHPVIAIKSEVKPTKDNDSGYLQFDLQVIDGPNKGAVGAYRLNLYHTNPQTVEIAHKQLSALCHVTGVFQVQDSQQLHNIPFMVEVGLQKEPNPNKYTDVKRVFDINGNEPGHANGNGQAAQNNGGQAGNNGGSWGNQQQNGGQNQQQNNGGNNAGWGGQSQVANNVPMPDNNGGNNQNQGQNNGGGNPGWGQNNGNNGQQGNQQGGGWQGNQQGNQGQQQGNGGGWNQNQGNGGGQPAWGQPR